MKLVILLAYLLFGGSYKSDTDPCENIEVKVEINHSQEGLRNGVADVKVSGNIKAVHYFFYDDKNYPISTDTKVNNLKNLAPGDYFCSVVSEEGCVKKIKFTVK